MPASTFLYSLIAVCGIALFDAVSTGEIVGMVLSVFFLMNIPTFVLLAIYFACKSDGKKKREIDKMNIQDLD